MPHSLITNKQRKKNLHCFKTSKIFEALLPLTDPKVLEATINYMGTSWFDSVVMSGKDSIIIRIALQRARLAINKDTPDAVKQAHSAREIFSRREFKSPKEFMDLMDECGLFVVFSMTQHNVDFAMYEWNPLAGCPEQCPHCSFPCGKYRFGTTDSIDHTFRNYLLSAPLYTAFSGSGNRRVLVAPRVDLFRKSVSDEVIREILHRCNESADQWHYVFITKHPSRLPYFTFPANSWVGARVDTPSMVKPTLKSLRKVSAGGRFISIETWSEEIVIDSFQGIMDFIIVGEQGISSDDLEI